MFKRDEGKTVKSAEERLAYLSTKDWERVKNGKITATSPAVVESAMNLEKAVTKVYWGGRVTVQVSPNFWYEGRPKTWAKQL